MCGLVGIIGFSLNKIHLDVFKWLLHLDVVRGEDSTGVAIKFAEWTSSKSKVVLLKTEGHPSSLYRKFPEVFSDNGTFRDVTKYKVNYAMGHNRSATIGSVTAANAHPFHHGSIVGAHNGTVHIGLEKLPKFANSARKTDSEHIIYSLSQGKTIKEITSLVRGAIALTWHDSDTNTYHLYRNKERTLYYWINPGKDLLVYASEAWMIRQAMTRAKVVSPCEPILLPADTHMTISFPTTKPDKLIIEEEKIEPVSVILTQSKYIYGANDDWDYYKHRANDPIYKPAAVVLAKPEDRAEAGWLKLDLDLTTFQASSRYGCVFCGSDLLYEEHKKGHVKWLDKDTPFCEECAKKFSQKAA